MTLETSCWRASKGLGVFPTHPNRCESVLTDQPPRSVHHNQLGAASHIPAEADGVSRRILLSI